MRYCILFLFIIIGSSLSAQTRLSDHVKDSLRKLVCHMNDEDQRVRNEWEAAKKVGDAALMARLALEFEIIDSANFVQLEKIIRYVGFPCPQLLGKGACYPFAIMIHWSKKRPEWFNDRSLVPVFRKEVELGHLPLSQLDFAIYDYVSFMDADVKLLPLVNEARTAYGLIPYTRAQYTKEEWIEPLTSDDDASRRSHHMRAGNSPVRNSDHN